MARRARDRPVGDDRGVSTGRADVRRPQRRAAFQVYRGNLVRRELPDARRSGCLLGKAIRGGGEVECGWVKDKFGLSWQIVPTVLFELLGDPDPKKSQRVMKATLGMKKLDIQGLKQAYANA
jgi:hypothetical protein